MNQKTTVKPPTRRQDLNVYTQLALDANKHKYPERYAFLYHELLKSDNGSTLKPFMISKLKTALEQLTKKERDIISKIFGLDGSTIHYFRPQNTKDIAFINFMKSGDEVLDKLRGLNLLCIYHEEIKEYVDLTAQKVWDPDGKYDNLTKAKYAILYYVYLYKYHRFPNDTKETLFSIQHQMIERTCIVLPYIIREVYNKVFKHLPDNDLIIEMIDSFFNGVGTELKEAVYSQAQLTNEGFSHCSLIKLRSIKEKLFPYGAWKTGIDFFFMSSIKELSITQFKQAAQANRYLCDDHTVPQHLEKIQFSTGEVNVTVHEYYKDFQISDPQELFMYAELHTFLRMQCPALPLGKKKIPFKKSSVYSEIFYLF